MTPCCRVYNQPTALATPLKGYLAFYPSKLDKAEVDGEAVMPQQGDFYGGWCAVLLAAEQKSCADTCALQGDQQGRGPFQGSARNHVVVTQAARSTGASSCRPVSHKPRRALLFFAVEPPCSGFLACFSCVRVLCPFLVLPLALHIVPRP